ncbi:hypothetical protein NFJ02_10g01410 [Pycnococcus provasolii]
MASSEPPEAHLPALLALSSSPHANSQQRAQALTQLSLLLSRASSLPALIQCTIHQDAAARALAHRVLIEHLRKHAASSQLALEALAALASTKETSAADAAACAAVRAAAATGESPLQTAAKYGGTQEYVARLVRGIFGELANVRFSMHPKARASATARLLVDDAHAAFAASTSIAFEVLEAAAQLAIYHVERGARAGGLSADGARSHAIAFVRAVTESGGEVLAAKALVEACGTPSNDVTVDATAARAGAALEALLEVRAVSGDTTTTQPAVAQLGFFAAKAASAVAPSIPNLHALSHACWLLTCLARTHADAATHTDASVACTHALSTTLLDACALAFPISSCPRDPATQAPLVWRAIAHPLDVSGDAAIPAVLPSLVCMSRDEEAIHRLANAASDMWRRAESGGNPPAMRGDVLTPHAARVCLSLARRSACFALANALACAEPAYHATFVVIARAGRLGWEQDGAGEPILDILGDAARGATDVAPAALAALAYAAEACATAALAIPADDADASLVAYSQLEGVLRACVPCVPKRASGGAQDEAARRICAVCARVASVSCNPSGTDVHHLPTPSCIESCFQAIGTLCGFLADELPSEHAITAILAPVHYFAGAANHEAAWRRVNDPNSGASAYRIEWFRRARRASIIAMIRILEARSGQVASTFCAMNLDIGAMLKGALAAHPTGLDPPLRGGQEPTRRVLLRCLTCCALARKSSADVVARETLSIAEAETARAWSTRNAAEIASALDELSVALEGCWKCASLDASITSTCTPATFLDHAADAALACLKDPIMLSEAEGRRALRTLLCSLVGSSTRMSVDGLLADAPRSSPISAFSGGGGSVKKSRSSSSPMEMRDEDAWLPIVGVCEGVDVDECVPRRVKDVFSYVAETCGRLQTDEENADALLTLLHAAILAYPRCSAFQEAARGASVGMLVALMQICDGGDGCVPVTRVCAVAGTLLRKGLRDRELVVAAGEAVSRCFKSGVAGDDAKSVLALYCAFLVVCDDDDTLASRVFCSLPRAIRNGRLPPSLVSDAAEAVRCAWLKKPNQLERWADACESLSTGETASADYLGANVNDTREFKKRFKSATGGKQKGAASSSSSCF